jgi:putative molybdopterin biosynthesis protein
MPHGAAAVARPSPDAAYAQWLAICTAAGWHEPSGAEQVPVQDALGRVTAAPVHACRPWPRFGGRAADGPDEEISSGELLIPSGHRLRSADLAIAAAAGQATLDVARVPVVAIIPTGDEIRPVGAALGPGDLIDTNSLMLALQARDIGADAIISGIQPDDPDAITAEIRRTALAADLVLVIAGSSAGRSDYAATAIAGAGALAVRGVAVRPGHPALLGYATPGREGAGRPVPVIGIPGYPLSAVVIFNLFAGPLLAALQGWRPPEPAHQQAELSCDWTSSTDAEHWVLVTLVPAGGHGGGTPLATPGRRGAGSISRLMRAHAWWRIPSGQPKFDRGELIDVQLIQGIPREPGADGPGS